MSELVMLLQQSADITTQIVSNEGVISPELENALTVIDVKTPVAVDRATMLMDRLQSEEDYWSNMAEKMGAIAKGCRTAREKMRDSIKEGMRQLEVKELQGETFRLVLTKAKPKLIVNEDYLDPEYIKTRQVTEADKDRIRADLEKGLEVEGAMLQESFGLRPYANTKGARG